jgi:hypothetical protein
VIAHSSLRGGRGAGLGRHNTPGKETKSTSSRSSQKCSEANELRLGLLSPLLATSDKNATRTTENELAICLPSRIILLFLPLTVSADGMSYDHSPGFMVRNKISNFEVSHCIAFCLTMMVCHTTIYK